jgi:4-hydroxyphenylpyruvate dioxygenase-like putative hemolysin
MWSTVAITVHAEGEQPMPVVEPGYMHRVAVAVEDAAGAAEWFTRILGAGPIGTDRHGNPGELALVEGDEDMAGTDARMVRVGGYPFILISGVDPDSPTARFVQRFGPGVHSLAWEVADMWVAQNLLLRHGVRTASASIAGRHFFMHPKDTHGLLMEWTDDSFGENVRRTEGGGVVDVESVAWVSAVVADAVATAAFLDDLAGGGTTTDISTPEDTAIEVRIGDVAVHVVTPRSTDSWFAPYAERGPRFCSVGLRVADLDAALVSLTGAGIATVSRSGGVARTDAATTCGVPIEWTA